MKKEYIIPVMRVISEEPYLMENKSVVVGPMGPGGWDPGETPETGEAGDADAKGNGTWDMDWDF